MGNLKDLASMIPGVGKTLKNVEITRRRVQADRGDHLSR